MPVVFPVIREGGISGPVKKMWNVSLEKADKMRSFDLC